MFDGFTDSRRTVAIIGGGPAGSATAIALLRALRAGERSNWNERFRVLIFNHPPKGTFRVGESLPPGAVPALRALGADNIIAEGSRHLACSGSSSVWGSDTPGHNDFMFDVIGRGHHLDRDHFDAQLLATAVRHSAELRHGWRLAGAKELYDGAELDFSTPEGHRRTVRADFVIDASGKAAAFARRIGVARNVLDEVLFFCAVAELPEGSTMTSRSLVEAVPDGWWYAARLPGEKLLVTFCTDTETAHHMGPSLAANWQDALARTRWLTSQVPERLFDTSPQLEIRAAPSSLLSAVVGDAWAAVGDAASSFDPVSSAGISKALVGAARAGAAAAVWLNEGRRERLNAYADMVLREFQEYARLRAELYAGEHRFRDSDFWRRRLGLKPEPSATGRVRKVAAPSTS